MHERNWARAGAAAGTIAVLLAYASPVHVAVAQPISRDDIGEPGHAMPQARAAEAEEHKASSLLYDGLALFAQGSLRDGQRLLELLIARFPNSTAATEARRSLAKLYAESQPDQADLASRMGSDRPAASSSPSAPIDARSSAPWRIDIRRSTEAEDDFRVNVGDRIFFSPGSSDLGGRARSVLQAQAKWLNRYLDVTAVIEGHADDPGDSATNQELSRQRAEAVRSRLIEEGVAPQRLVVAARGTDDRVAECKDASCAAHNRRAVTTLIMTEPERELPPPQRVGERGPTGWQPRQGLPAPALTGARGQGQ